MRFNPHDYQKQAIRFIKDHESCALFLDMGLGKTVSTLTAINDMMYDSLEVSSVLVVAPIRVCWQWETEIAKWDHLRDLTVAVAVGSEEERRRAVEADVDITVINRENVVWLRENYPERKWDMLVVDELSSFKSHQSKRFKALRKMRPSFSRCVGLTGTPAPNGLMDLWAEFSIIDCGRSLGYSIGRYRTEYFRPGKTNGFIVYSYTPRKGAEEDIYRRISPITLSMKALDHLKMPRLITNDIEVRMDPRERKLYDTMKEDMVLETKGMELTAVNAASLCGKLTQMANGAVYGDDGEHHHIHYRKLDALVDLVEASNGKPLLIAYWYRHDLERIKIMLATQGIGCEEIGSRSSIDRWNRREIPVGLIHPASAGHGLNLQAGGSTLVWFGLTWSLELYQQTNARLWRQGQTEGTVVIYHIVTKDTVDARILAALKGKDMTQNGLMEAVRKELKEEE